MKLAAAQAIASLIGPEELHEDYIIPSVFNQQVVERVVRAVILAARKTGIARRSPQDPGGVETQTTGLFG